MPARTVRTRRRRGFEAWRLFAATPLSAPVRDLLGSVRDELEPLGWPIRWVDPEIAHITLKFYGDTPVGQISSLASRIAWIAGRSEPHQLLTNRIGAFPSTRRPRVVWLGLTGNVVKLERIAEDIDEVSTELGFTPERRRFRAHITLGRLRGRNEPPEDFEAVVTDLSLPKVELPIDRVQLMRSELGPEGPNYSVVDEWFLGQKLNELGALEGG